MELNEVLLLLVAIAGLGFQTFAIIKYLIDRMDAKIAEERNAREDDMKTVTKKSEFDRHVEHVDRQFAQVREDIKSNNSTVMAAITGLGTTLGNRLDNLMLSLGTSNNNKG